MRPIHVVLALSLALNCSAVLYFVTRTGETPAKPAAARTTTKTASQTTPEKKTAGTQTTSRKTIPATTATSTESPAKKPAARTSPTSPGKKPAGKTSALLAAKYRERYNFLPPGKVAQMEKIDRDYAELRKLAFVESKTLGSGKGDSSRFALLREEQRRDIEALLTPGELGEYDKRFSSAGLYINRVTENMNSALSADERTTVYELRKAIDDAFPLTGFSADNPPDNEYVLYRTLALEKVTNEIKAMLGEERYYDYERAHSMDYRNLKKIAADNGLPTEVANNIYALRDTISAESQRIARDRAMSYEEKRQVLAELAEQTRARVRTELGADAGNAYLERNMTWLRYVEQGASFRFKGAGDGVMFSTLKPPAKK